MEWIRYFSWSWSETPLKKKKKDCIHDDTETRGQRLSSYEMSPLALSSESIWNTHLTLPSSVPTRWTLTPVRHWSAYQSVPPTVLSALYSSQLPQCQNWDFHMGLSLCHMLVCCDHRQKIRSSQTRVKIRSAMRNVAPSSVHWDASPDYIANVSFCEVAFRASWLL